MKNLEDWAAVQRIYKQTGSKRQTAKILGISRNTVKRLLKIKEPPKYHRKKSVTLIDDFSVQIEIWRCEPYQFNGTRIFRELKKRGFNGSIATVYRFLRALEETTDGSISKKATVRTETPPGDQAQFDWSEYQVPVGGRVRTVYCFSIILACSRKKAICFSLREDAEAIYEAIQELFDELGGVTLELLIDNPKALVIENNPNCEEDIRYNPHALLLAKHLGTELNACPCFWPRKKGKVERPFNYIEEQFIKGNSFENMEELNRRGKEFVDNWCNEKHTTTQRVPNQYYVLEELSLLQPLPEKHYYITGLKSRIVSPDSLVSINGNKYSVPVKYVDRKVYFRLIFGFRIQIFDKKNEKILEVEAADGKKNIVKQDEHYEPIRKAISTSMPQIRRDFTTRFNNGARYLDEMQGVCDQPLRHARKILELQDLYEDWLLEEFIEKAINEKKLGFGPFKEMLREYNTDRTNNLKERIQSVSTEAITRDCSYYENL